MERAEDEALICSARGDAVTVPFKEVALGDRTPKISDCHNNVDRWIAANHDCKAVRGWISYISYGPAGEQLTGPSVVRNADGTLIDITPVYPGAPRGSALVEPRGDPAVFFAIKDHDIRCPSLNVEADAAELEALIAAADGFEPNDDAEEWE